MTMRDDGQLSGALAGTWQLSIRTPIGTLRAAVELREERGVLTGTATGRGESVPLRAVTMTTTAAGEHLTWSQSITKPMRLDLDFDVIVVGEQMEGHSRAGRLPRSAVTGTRDAPPREQEET